MRLLTFNIRTSSALADLGHHWLFRRRAVRRTVRAVGADVVALQEVRPGQLRFLARQLPRHRIAAAGRDGRGRGEACPVLVGPAWSLESWQVRWLSRTPDVPGSVMPGAAVPRICTVARLREVATGVRVTVANTHLDHRSRSVRARSVRLLAEWAAGDPTPWVVVGDLNCRVDAPELEALLDAGWTDALTSLPSTGAGSATYHGFVGSTDGPRIDQVLVTPRVRTEAARVLHATGRPASDHWPVVADLSFTESSG